MNALRFPGRFRTRGFTLFAGLLVLLAVVAGGLHHHDESAHPCGICSLSHASATVVVAAVSAHVSWVTERLFPAHTSTPCGIDLRTPSSRAPPSA